MCPTQTCLMSTLAACRVKRSDDPRQDKTNLQGSLSALSSRPRKDTCGVGRCSFSLVFSSISRSHENSKQKLRPLLHLDALLELVSRRGRPLPEQLAEDDDLLEEKDPSFFGARQDAGILLRHEEGFLLQQLSLAGQFTLRDNHTFGSAARTTPRKLLLRGSAHEYPDMSVDYGNLLRTRRAGSERTSYPCSRPKFIISLHSLGT